MNKVLRLLKKDRAGEKKAIKDYGNRKKQIPELSKMYSEIQSDEKDHKKKLESKMPVKSAKQFRFMEMMAHSKKKMKKGAGPSKKVAEEMLEKTSHKMKSKFAKDRD